MIYTEKLKLDDDELDKFSVFLEEHRKCSNNLSLVRAYNVKLIFNIYKDSIVPTCLCTVCGGELLLANQERYKEI